MSKEKLRNIINDLFDILVIGGKLLISYIRDGVNVLSSVWKDDHLTPPRNDDDGVWHGGVTNLRGSGINDTQEDNTLVYDEYSFDNQEIITYDGIMGDIDDDNNG